MTQVDQLTGGACFSGHIVVELCIVCGLFGAVTAQVVASQYKFSVSAEGQVDQKASRISTFIRPHLHTTTKT